MPSILTLTTTRFEDDSCQIIVHYKGSEELRIQSQILAAIGGWYAKMVSQLGVQIEESCGVEEGKKFMRDMTALSVEAGKSIEALEPGEEQ